MKTAPDFAPILRAAHLKVTTGRRDLLLALHAVAKPVTVSYLVETLDGALNEVTVYRALEAFRTAGIVRSVDLRHGHAHYELAVLTPHHHHLVCTGCGLVEDVHTCPVAPATERSLLSGSKHFNVVQSHDLEFFGQCQRCV